MGDPTLFDLTLDGLVERIGDLPRYRADQVWNGVYRTLAESYEEISPLPRALRARLTRTIPFTTVEPVRGEESRDRDTRKDLFRLADGEAIESVTMRVADRRTVCVSSQVGCPIACPFCATGQAGFVRNLTTGEIVAQVLHAARRLRRAGTTLTHVVYMGMGEPFLNYDATLTSIRILNDPRGFGLGARSFTVSTAGIVPAIDRFAGEKLQANLAVSLHAADDPTRDRLVPVNRRYPLESLLAACRRYVERTRRRITFEVTLFDGVNDSARHARALVARLSDLLCHVNLIPYNATPDSPLGATSPDRIRAFAAALADARLPVTVRRSRGADIEAGCGQLRGKRTETRGPTR